MAEPKIISLPLAKIRAEEDTQPRVETDQTVVDEYAEALDATPPAQFPPVVVFYDGRTYRLANGFHRYFAHQQAGRKYILADVRPGGKRDAILHAAGSNQQHGLRRTNDDKRRAACLLLGDDEWSLWPDREVARHCGVSHTLVSRLRYEMGGNGCQKAPAEEEKGGWEAVRQKDQTADLRGKRVRRMRRLARDLRAVADRADAGEVVSGIRQVEDALERLEAIQAQSPAAICPACGGSGRVGV